MHVSNPISSQKSTEKVPVGYGPSTGPWRQRLTFADVERALAARPSVFTETQRTILRRIYGLEGDAPAPIATLAKELRTTKAHLRQMIPKAEAVVQAVNEAQPEAPLPLSNELLPHHLRRRVEFWGVTDVRQLAAQRPSDFKRAGFRKAETAMFRALVEKHGLALAEEEGATK